MAVKRGLNMGRGLEALFPQRSGTEKKEEPGDKPEKDSSPGAKGEKPAAMAGKGGVKGEKPAAKAGKDGAKEEKPAAKAVKGSAKREKPAAKAGKSGAKTSKSAEKAAEVPAKKMGPADGKGPAAAPADEKDVVRMLKISEIVPNSGQPRKDFDEEAISELAASIREFGVLQPLLLQKKGAKYEIIAGERRWRAAKKAGMKQIPAIVREYTDRETFEISLIENLQRENLNPLEEALAYRRLIDEFGLTQEAVAQRVSKSRTAVTNSLRLLRLEEEVRQMLASGALSMGHARALLAIEDPAAQVMAAKGIVEGDLSVRDTERLVKRLLHPAPPREKSRSDEQIDAVFHSIEERLRRRTGTKVMIRRGHGSTGRIEIEYYSQEDLERIISLIE